MNCLCCGKPLKADDGSGWHKSCIKRFFGTPVLPEIEIDDQTLESIVTESVGKGLTVPGVQKKLSLHLFSDGEKPRLTLVNFPTGYILKPQTEEFTALPESEQLVMHMADVCGIATVPHALIAEGGSCAYITKRVDRVIEKSAVSMLAMEDFCQLDLRLTADKYKGSYERCAKIIERYSSRRAFDLAELFASCVLLYDREFRYAPQEFLADRDCGKQRRIYPFARIRPAARQRDHAGGQRAVRPHDERQESKSAQGRFPEIRRRLRHLPHRRGKNDCPAACERTETAYTV